MDISEDRQKKRLKKSVDAYIYRYKEHPRKKMQRFLYFQSKEIIELEIKLIDKSLSNAFILAKENGLVDARKISA